MLVYQIKELLGPDFYESDDDMKKVENLDSALKEDLKLRLERAVLKIAEKDL